MTTKRKPNGWSVVPEQESHGACLCIQDNERGVIIARTPECSEYGAPEQKQDAINAAKMAAAPEMLAALQLFIDARSGRYEHVTMQVAEVAARAAIAKAIGVQL